MLFFIKNVINQILLVFRNSFNLHYSNGHTKCRLQTPTCTYILQMTNATIVGQWMVISTVAAKH